jgi:radical SAM protein with 4Fe4S-binding SPASM domain
MHDQFPVVQPHFELHLTREESTLIHAKRGSGLPRHKLGMEVYNQWHLSRLTTEYLLQCDGQTSHGEISRRLQLPFSVLADQIAHHLMTSTSAVAMSAQPVSGAAPLFVTGSFDSYAPLHMSVEITDTCNFRCDHCYVSASPEKLARREGEDLFTLFGTMRENGVRVVELTGGECTTHPEFKEILACAARTFHLVAIVSNGYLLGTRDGLAEFVGSFDNVACQVSIDGDEAFHDAFRKKAGSYASAVEAVRRLKALGLCVRVAMSVTAENVEHVVHVYELANELRVDAFSAAPTSAFGRGAGISSCGSKDHEVLHRLNELLRPFAAERLFEANRISAKWMKESTHQNCGAGWRSFGLNGATGEVRSCLFLADSKKFGSVDQMSYSDLFKQQEMDLFRHAPSPSPHLKTCSECEHISECRGCFAKAFLVSETKHPGCAWRARYFPGMSLARSTALVPVSKLRRRRLPDTGQAGSVSDPEKGIVSRATSG